MREEATPAALRAVLNGDTEAFRAILHDYGPRVERLVSAHVLPHEIPEVAQETFVRAYKSLRSYDGRGSFERYRPEGAFASLTAEDGEEERLTDQASWRLYEEESERRDMRERLEAALGRLEPRDRMVLTLTFLEGRSVAETAQLMDMSEINVRVRVHRSKARLRAILERLDAE